MCFGKEYNVVIPNLIGNLNKHMKTYWVYILASKKDGVLYIGITSNLRNRIYEHKKGMIEGFTKQYFVHRLVYVEETEDVYGALEREKQLKKWNREWKVHLIEKENPEWRDLYETILS